MYDIQVLSVSLPLNVSDDVAAQWAWSGYSLYDIQVWSLSLPLGLGDGVGPSVLGVGIGCMVYWH